MTSPTVATTPTAPKSSLWEDFIDIFYAPSQVYARRRDGRFWPALLIYGLLSLALFFAFRAMFAEVMDAEMSRGIANAMRQNPEMTAEAAAGARAQGERFARVLGPASALLGPPFLFFILGLGTWLVGKMFGSTQQFGQAVTIATYANFPRLLGGVLSGALFLIGQPERVTSQHSIGLSPLRFVDEAALSPIVTALLGRFDLFTLWTTVLLGVGLRVIGGLTKEKAAMGAGVLWLLGTLIALAGAARQAAAAG